MASPYSRKLCSECGGELGPWEGRRCLSCSDRASLRLTNGDAAALVLEQSPSPLTVYDIARGIGRDCGIDVAMPSLNVALASDPRFCWAGRGLYALYRHGIYPGPRNLMGVARLFLYAVEPQQVDALRFVLREAGYRVQRQSLHRVLESDDLIKWSRLGYGISSRGAVRQDLVASGTGKGPTSFARCIAKCRYHAELGLAEYRRRLR
jgi:hypothetical protein